MGAATAERLGSTPFWCTPKLLSFRSFALLLRSIKPDRENATNVHDDVQSIFKLPSSYTALPPSHSHAARTFSFARSLSNYLVSRLSVTVLLARAPYRDSRHNWQPFGHLRRSSSLFGCADGVTSLQRGVVSVNWNFCLIFNEIYSCHRI